MAAMPADADDGTLLELLSNCMSARLHDLPWVIVVMFSIGNVRGRFSGDFHIEPGIFSSRGVGGQQGREKGAAGAPI